MSSFILEYTLPESTSLLGDVNGMDSSQSLPPLMHMGYASAGRHPGMYCIHILLWLKKKPMHLIL